MNLMRKLFRLPPPRLEVRDEIDPSATPEKLEEAEVWTKQRRDETEMLKRELLRYELDLQLDHRNKQRRTRS